MISTLATIAYRDFIKLIRDKTRLVTSLIFPMLFIGILGSSLQANLSEDIGYNFITFIFTGVLGQTLFQSTASGIVSLVEDRVNDFSQEMFVAPINRYTIIFGKILGETSVSLVLASSILIIGFVIGVPITAITLISILPVALICCLLGGAFGVLVVANLGSERAANQIFPFIIFPQYFLSGVFNPIKELPFFLDILSKLTPMRYAVDLMRSVYYSGSDEYSKVVLNSPTHNLIVIGIMFTLFLFIGTQLFVRGERNR